MNKNIFEFTKIRDNIWQIAEDNGVYCTLVKGTELAVLIDTGFGKRDLRTFVEKNVSTPYMVINSHGHPDHIGGNHWFHTVYALQEEWDVIRHFEGEQPRTYDLKEIQIGQSISLGNMNMVVVPLTGHSDKEYPKEKLISHLRNIENLRIDDKTKRSTIGFETYSSAYEDSHGKSEILFTIDKV